MSNIIITIIGISFIFLMTVLGGSVVFLFRKNISGRLNSLFLGFASGLMIAASIWSLIVPAIEQSESYGNLNFLPASLGIIIGAFFLVLMSHYLPYLIKRKRKGDKKGISKPAKLFLAVTLHNIPEGLAVGLAFGNAFIQAEMSAFYSALWFAIGIGIQNFPEGSAISLPLGQSLKSGKKAFWYSVLSGAVEPIMAIVGVLLATSLSAIMPWMLAMSAGAMLFVVAEELLPEAKASNQSNIGAWGLIAGFVLMMILDVALGWKRILCTYYAKIKCRRKNVF